MSDVGAPDPEALSSAVLPTATDPAATDIESEGGLFAGLFRRPRSASKDLPVGDAPEFAEASVATIADPAASGGTGPKTTLAADIEAAVAAAHARPSPRGRLFGWLRNAANSERTEPQVKLASLSPDDTVPRQDVGAKPVVPAATARAQTGTGLGLRRSVRGLPIADAAPGTRIAFGEIVRVCGVKGSELGRVTDQGARKGRSYKLHDTDPDAAGPRTFYITGFADNCPRQFTASIALFGSPQMHEQLRYGLPAEEYPYSTTDKAYEKVKASVCNVGRSKPCGDRIERLDRTTVFVSVYENFGENARWADMLIHDGVLLAKSLKTP